MTSQDVILGMLMKRSMAGYDIKQMLETVFSYFYNASFGTIYPTLGKMEQQGLITKQSIVQEGKPNKNVYTITEEGRRQFLHYLNSGIHPVEVKSDFMVRLFFGDLASRELVAEWLTLAVAETGRVLRRLQDDYERWKERMNDTQILCIRLGIESNAAHLRLLEEALHTLENPERSGL